jgi:L-serine dehydratase
MINQKRILSIFDILGPIMIGPSSNHTAGAVRIGKIAGMILGEEPTCIKLYFYGSLAETYKGHMTDAAVVAGLLGMEVDDQRIKESLKIASNRKIGVKIYTQTISDKNPNTIEMELKSNSFLVKISTISIGGGEITLSNIDEFKVNFSGNKDMIILILKEKQSEIISKVKSILGENLISIESIKGDSRYLICFYLDSVIDKSRLELIMSIKGVNFIRLIKSLYSYKLKDDSPLFRTIKEMLSIAKVNNKFLPQVIIEYESKRSGLKEKEIRDSIKQIWHVMEEEINQGLTKDNRLIGGLMSGKDAKMLYKALNENKLVFGRPLSLAVARAIACGEVNASMGKVVAAPTAGACGVIPAVILTTAEKLGSKEKDIIDALLVAAGIGVVIAYTVPLSGAMGGCQSEVGVASAMAAAAIVQMAGGNSEQVAHAMALALKNIFGLVCDTVAGPAEVPCIKRNVIGVANAFAVADMALAGIQSIIPPDEVIVALRNIQTLMPMELRDTTLGGLGMTETAKRLKKEWLEKIK